MTLYERYLGRPSTKQDAIHEREYYLSRISTKKEMLKRWKRIGYELPKAKQLKLEL